ncbi:MAG TPA: SHOCT domain-containing protein [Nocardioidaceae bacterium]
MDDDFYGPRGRGNGPGWDGWEMHDGWGAGAWVLMVLLLLLLFALIVAVVVLAVRAARRAPHTGSSSAPVGPSTAEQVLDERFARGEIDEEEYLRKRSVLRERPPDGG